MDISSIDDIQMLPTIMKTTFDDPNIECKNEYDSLVDVYFKGKPFTGTIVDGLETINYKEGKVHGQYTIHFDSGQLRSDEVYENGEIVSSITYYENGQKETELLNNSYYKWTQDGTLIQKDKEHYFENGKLRILRGKEKDSFAFKYFTPNGDLIYTQRKDVWVDNHYERVIDYNHDLMFEWHFELLNKIITDDSENQRVHHIWMWYWEVFEQDQEKYFEVVNKLLVHPSEEVVKCIASIIAIHRFHPYIQSENEKNSKAYEFIRDYTKYQEEKFPNREVKKVSL